MKRLICLYIFFCSCTHLSIQEQQMEQVLLFAADNRSELEFVLKHYAHDSLKLEAAKFLIRNMRHSYSYQQGGEMDSVKQARNGTDIYGNIDQHLVRQWGGYTYEGVSKIYDAHVITSRYLIDNIDQAFEQWQKRPWGKYLSFEDFCEYLLPYRIGNEPIEEWRKLYADTFGFLLDSLYLGSDVIEAANQLNTYLKEPKFRYCEQFNLPNVGALHLYKHRVGGCKDAADIFTYVCCAIGIPCTEETNVRGGHIWNVVKDTTGLDIPYWYNNYITYRGNPATDGLKKGKVYRVMNELQFDATQKYTKEEWNSLYPYYKNPYLKDVSHYYFSDTLLFRPEVLNLKEGELIYLSFFYQYRWWSCGVTKVQKGQLLFNNIESDMMYTLHKYQNGVYRQIYYPFFFSKGKIHVFKPEKEQQLVTLWRKYPTFDWLTGVMQYASGATLDASDDMLFRQNTFICRIDTPKIAYNQVLLDKPLSHRYIRFQAEKDKIIDFAEISIYYQGKQIKPVSISGSEPNDENPKNRLENLIDNDQLTYFTCKQRGGYAIIDLGKNPFFDRIVYFPHNDDNYIHPGDCYELFYNGGDKGWISLGRKIADTTFIQFQVPHNTLLWLRDLTKGHEEQAFYMENGKQIFPMY